MLSQRARNITPSATCELEGTVAALKAKGVDVISFNIGEPDFHTPESIKDACKRALDENKTTYVDIAGVPPLRQAICDKLWRDNHVSYKPEQICVSTGAKQAINNAVIAITNPGDEVIIPIPGWVSYVEIVKLAGCVPVCVETREDYQLDIPAIEAAITPKTKAILLNTPNNPTGAVYTRESLEHLMMLAESYDFYIISDEIYERLVYGENRHVCVASLSPEAYRRTIVINGLSKTYCMTGWRIGYSAAPLELARGLKDIQGHMTSNSTTFVQYAAIEALNNSEESIREMVAAFEARRQYAYSRLCAMEGIVCRDVGGAFYLLPDVSYYYGRKARGKVIRDSFDLCNFLLEAYQVAMVPGGAFLSPNTVRVAYTVSMDEIREGMDRIEQALQELKP